MSGENRLYYAVFWRMNNFRGIGISTLVLSVVAIVACLYVLSGILIPIVTAAFLAILFRPLIDLVRRLGAPTWIGLIVALAISGTAIWGISAIIEVGVDSAIERAPIYAEKINRLLASMQSTVSQLPGGDDLINNARNMVSPETGIGIASSWLGSAASVIVDGFAVLLYLVFIILGSSKFTTKLEAAAVAANSQSLLQVYSNVNTKVLNYLRIKTLFNLLNAALVFAVLSWQGVDFAPVIAMLSFFFSYLPNIGSLLTVALTGIISLVQFESVGVASVTVGILVVVGAIIGSGLEPRAMGQSLNLSPVVVLFSLVFWGWMWGIVGMVLSVPIMAVLRAVMEQFPTTKPIAILISNQVPAPAKAP